MTSLQPDSKDLVAPQVNAIPAPESPYKIIRAEDVAADFKAVRRYEAFFRWLEIKGGSARQQVIFTDDVERMCSLLSNFFLHAQHFGINDDCFKGLMAGLGAAFSMSNEEMVKGGPDKKRTAIKRYSEIVRVESGSPKFEALLDEIYRQSKPPYKPEIRPPFALLTDRLFSGAFVDFFEAKDETKLFIATIKPPEDLKAAHDYLDNQFARSMYLLGEAAWDYRDVMYRVPPIIWVLPMKHQIPTGPLSILCASNHYCPMRPFNEWLDWADSLLERPANPDWFLVNVFRSGLHMNRMHILDALNSNARGVKKHLSQMDNSKEKVMAFLGLSEVEFDYLTTLNFEYWNNPDPRWEVDEAAKRLLGLSRIPTIDDERVSEAQ